VADKDKKKPKTSGTSAKPGFDPKPVTVGGDSIIERLQPYTKQIVIGVLAVTAVVIAVFAVRMVKERGRKHETAKLAKVLAISERQVRPEGSPEPAPTDKEPTFATNKERAEAVLDEMTKQGVKNADARTKLEKAKELGAGTQLAELVEERLAGLGA
jgi:hypothetical protein